MTRQAVEAPRRIGLDIIRAESVRVSGYDGFWHRWENTGGHGILHGSARTERWGEEPWRTATPEVESDHSDPALPEPGCLVSSARDAFARERDAVVARLRRTEIRMTGLSAGASTRFGALRFAPYRRYWLGSAASVGGFQLLIMGQGWLVFELSGSPLQLGFLGAASSIPTIAAALVGGVIADRVDRRRMLIATSSIIAGLLALLAVLDGSGVVAVWHVLAIAAAIALIVGLDFPSRQAFFPSLIGREHMMSAVALNSMLWQGSRMFLPALGGVVIALTDTWVVFAAGAMGFIAMTRVMASFAPTPAADVPLAVGSSGRQFVDGFRFIASRRMFAVLILLTYATTFFGISYVQLMPAFARLLGASEAGYGLLLSATGVGAVTGTLIVTPLQRSPRLGRLLLAAPMGGAAALIAFNVCVALLPGQATGYVFALVCAMLAAMCMSMYFVSSMTLMQLAVPDALRGRVMGIYSICFSLIPLGGLLGGVVAAVTSPPFAAALNAGVLAAIVAWVAVTQPSIRRLDGGSQGLDPPDLQESRRGV